MQKGTAFGNCPAVRANHRAMWPRDRQRRDHCCTQDLRTSLMSCRLKTMASIKVALLLLGAFALAAVASADKVQNGGKVFQGQYWESKGFVKVDKDLIKDEPKPPKEPKDFVGKPS